MTVSGYADYHQLYQAFDTGVPNAEIDAVLSMESCITDVRNWMLQNQLKINDTKTEYILLGTKPMLSWVTSHSIKVGVASIEKVHTVCNLGVIFDENLNMSSHITKICNFHLYNLRSMRKFLTKEASIILVHSLIFSQLDYCNALLYGLPDYQIRRLQFVQNAAARFVSQTLKYDHIKHILKELHWLPIKYRILYKIALLTFKAINNLTPIYITDMIIRRTTRYQLRSSSSTCLEVPRSKHKTLGDRAFAIAAPTVWNSLPVSLREINSLGKFKSELKTFYFNLAFLGNCEVYFYVYFLLFIL